MTREQDVQKLIDSVLEVEPDFYDNPNGGYEYTCPFCFAEVSVGGGSNISMADLKHDPKECAWLIARDLNTGNG
jgi:hypothetical protein